MTPFQKLTDACKATGLPIKYLRAGCRDGTIPHLKSGNTYYVNVVALLRQLGVPMEDESHAEEHTEAGGVDRLARER